MPRVRQNALARQDAIEATPAQVNPTTPEQIVPWKIKLEFPKRVVTTPKITPAQVKVLIYLWDAAYNKDSDGQAFPRQGTIAHDLGLSRSEVSRALTGAAELGLVQIVRRQRSALYLFPWSSKFGSDVTKSAHQNRKKPPSRCDEKRTSDVMKSAHLGAGTLYSLNVPTERTSSSSDCETSEQAAAERKRVKVEGAEPEPARPSQPAVERSQAEEAKVEPSMDLRPACRQVVSGPVTGSTLRKIEAAAGEDRALMAEFLALKRGAGKGEGFLVHLSRADEWPTWRDDRKAAVQAEARERDEQRRRDERLARMVPCPQCKGTGWRDKAPGSNSGVVACDCYLGRVDPSTIAHNVPLTGSGGLALVAAR